VVVCGGGKTGTTGTDDEKEMRMSTLVRHVMATEPKTARPDMNAFDAAALMGSYDVGSIPIVGDDGFVGIVTDRDLVLRVLAARKDPHDAKLGEVLTRDPVTISPDATLAEARGLMSEHRIRRLPVTKGDELVGIVSIGDVAVADASARAVGETLRDVSESQATADRAGGPDPGTPERVMDAREGSA
jgi:CBS domain-containing protein